MVNMAGRLWLVPQGPGQAEQTAVVSSFNEVENTATHAVTLQQAQALSSPKMEGTIPFLSASASCFAL